MWKITLWTVGIGTLCLFCGCVLIPIALVSGGVIGGIAISEDTVQNEFDYSYDAVWNASVDVLEESGFIEAKDKEIGTIKGYVPKSKVTITVSQLTKSTVTIQVKARKSAGVVPDINTAHRVAHRIAAALEETSGDQAPGKES
jgi:hypothetical protein